ncbi:cleavage stimulation factor subunit 3-like [Uloborus diversus]|uniref:cleavage stimulation factor subunit 3-like n=1 Tax=Uloborus diversus TaxID=327109 RepID=UPI002409BD6E|nr:cleavage stimulation factor subunit 3-like [Uloborus diversus]
MTLFEDQNHLGFIQERLKKAEKRLEEHDYDAEAWSTIVREANTKKIEEARPYYEKVVAKFPSTGRYWKLYIEHEMKSRHYERVEKLFTRCLVKVLNIDLWKTYLSYVKETKGSLPSYREKMAQAYDFALDKMGMDIGSYPIWSDYITFLKNVEAVGSYAENQRITAVRKVYQRGIINPMTNIEQLWKDYVSYEQSINPIIADKMIQDRSRDYMNARRVAKEYEAVTRGLNRNALSTPPQGTPEELKQVDLWKRYIAWEKGNPLRTEDQSVLTKRVMFAYEQCLLCLGHHPDIWYEAALFLEQSSKLLIEKGDLSAGKLFSDEAAAIYDRATTTFLKTNMLLHFAYADFEEGRMKYDKVRQIYEKFIENPDIDPTLAYIQYMKFARRAEGIKSARTIFRKMREHNRTRHHIFVAAALMEYYCSKEANVAFKIFELGLKKYGDNPDYILAYVDYLSHLNDDNNTRVLFERVLSTGSSLPPEKQIEIWNKFLEFESNVGDLASILKVEKRRAAIIEQLKEFEGKETALLIDRYKFMDLYPCTVSELKSLGYKEIAKQHSSGIASSFLGKDSILEDEKDKKPPYPVPDTLQMIPFKPRQIYPTAAHPVPGGVFPPPPSASYIMTLLPPPTSFHGPFVSVDDLIKVIQMWRLPENPPRSTVENGVVKDIEKFFEQAISASDVKKRKIDGLQDESDDEEGGLVPPIKDVYRARQQKKVK